MFYFVFVTFGLVAIDVFSVDVLAAVLILIVWLDTFPLLGSCPVVRGPFERRRH